MTKILVLQGPNLNLLGQREPDIYGSTTLDSLHQELSDQLNPSQASIDFFQSNSESELIDAVHQAMQHSIDYIIINPAAFTHTSVALRDAIAAANIPFYEVHISNVYRREPFRHHSYFSDLAEGVICGLGLSGYSVALNQILSKLN